MDSLLEQQYTMDSLMPLMRETLAQGNSVKFSPRGTSMLPMLRQGIDRVSLSPIHRELKKFDIALYQRENGQYVLHRIVEAGDSITCIGDNQFEFETGLSREQMIAVVTSFQRAEKWIDCSSLSYQCYVRLWTFSRPLRYLWRRGKAVLRRLLK